jgi:DNA invertase Pin-like site-specific DNA recombinase
MPAMRCACYARYSSDLQRETSIEDQLSVAREYANRHAWVVLNDHTYTDAGISGASLEGRPGIQALLAATRQRPLPFDVLLVDDSSRVARDLADALRVMQELRFAGVRVIYISQGIDSASEQAETLVTVHGLVDGLYLREMAAKIRRGLAGQADRGYHTGARVFGYRSIAVPDPSGRLGPDGRPLLLGKRLEIEESEAAVVRQVFTWYAEGVGVTSITARLNAAGKRRFSYTAVRNILWNQKYIGRYIWNQRRFERRPGSRAKVARLLPENEWKVYERPELRIVDETTWQRVQTRLTEVRSRVAPSGLMRGRDAVLHSRHLFSGFMRCGTCGGTVTTVSGGYGTPRYGCQRASKQGAASCANRLTIRAKVADAALLAGLRAFLLEERTIEYVTAALSARLNALIDERPRLKALKVAERETLERKLTHLVQAIEDGAATSALFTAMKTREREIATLEAEIQELDGPLSDRLAVIPSWVRSQVADVAKLLSDAPERAKSEFQRLGVAFTLSPIRDEGRPFLRAEAQTDLSVLMAGREATDFTTTYTSDLR